MANNDNIINSDKSLKFDNNIIPVCKVHLVYHYIRINKHTIKFNYIYILRPKYRVTPTIKYIIVLKNNYTTTHKFLKY